MALQPPRLDPSAGVVERTSPDHFAREKPKRVLRPSRTTETTEDTSDDSPDVTDQKHDIDDLA